MSPENTYADEVIGLLQRLTNSQGPVLDQVAEVCADTIVQRGMIHLFGSGHSVIPTLEAFPRYGSFVGLHPLTDPRLMWHNVLGPGGVRELLWLERTENYVQHFLDHEPLNEGDVLVVYSHGGRNAAGIEAAMLNNLSNALIESTNTKIRVLHRMAFGFAKPEHLIALALLDRGGYCPPLPGRQAA